jgi:hypothetical protein
MIPHPPPLGFSLIKLTGVVGNIGAGSAAPGQGRYGDGMGKTGDSMACGLHCVLLAGRPEQTPCPSLEGRSASSLRLVIKRSGAPAAATGRYSWHDFSLGTLPLPPDLAFRSAPSQPNQWHQRAVPTLSHLLKATDKTEGAKLVSNG